jgi:hypothetical protein
MSSFTLSYAANIFILMILYDFCLLPAQQKGGLKSMTVKYGRESQETRTRERLRWQELAAYKKDRPVLSLERAPHKKQNRNCQRVINIWSWVPDRARHQDLLTDWLTDRQSQCDFDFDLVWGIVAVCCENQFCGQNAGFYYVRTGGTYNDHWALKG